MKILNYREGFASNSSSTHSVWFGPGAKDIKDKLINSFDYQYGWENFVLKSENEILNYLMVQYKKNFEFCNNLYNLKSSSDLVIKPIMKEIFGIEPSDELLSEGYIDHQSQWLLPRYQHDTRFNIPSIEFMKEILNKMNSVENLFILGGNDNEEQPDPIPNTTELQPLNTLQSLYSNYKNIFCRKDKDTWVFFWKDSGRKLRFSFNDDTEYTKAYVPELVDLIITNQCNRKCHYCYRDCNQDGNYSDLFSVRSQIKKLCYMGVLEIAIGGGDLLEYPYINDLCDYVKEITDECDVAINTTLSIPPGIINDKETILIKKIIDSFSGVAFTVTHEMDILKCIARYVNDLDYEIMKKISFQMIPELCFDTNQVKRIINAVDIFNGKLTLLGFKNTGRGNSLTDLINKTNMKLTETFDEWFKFRPYGIQIGVDTQFVKNFPKIKELDKENYEWMITEEEGKFSCCIDLPNNVMSESSYSGELHKLPKTFDNDEYMDEFLKIFAKF